MSNSLQKEDINNNVLKITIKDIAHFDGGGSCSVKIVISQDKHLDTREFILFSSQKESLDLSCSDITHEKFSEIEHSAKICEAIKHGALILSYGRNSAYILKQKLCRKGYGREVANEAVLYLVNKGYINEIADIEQETQNCINKLWGNKKIISYLYTKGFGGKAIRFAEELLETVDFEDNCLKFLRKKFKSAPQTHNERNKIIATLMRYGYNSYDIRHALNSFISEFQQ